MAGKGSRQRTYGSAFDANYDRIFGKSKREEMGTEWVAPEDSQGSSRTDKSALPQYPREALERAQKGTQRPSEDV